MDPEQTLIDYFEAAANNDQAEAEDHLADLLHWIQKDGVAPSLQSPKLRTYLERELTADIIAAVDSAEAAAIEAWATSLLAQAPIIDTRPGREDSHAPLCGSRTGGECTCGKADREMEDDDAEGSD